MINVNISYNKKYIKECKYNIITYFKNIYVSKLFTIQKIKSTKIV